MLILKNNHLRKWNKRIQQSLPKKYTKHIHELYKILHIRKAFTSVSWHLIQENCIYVLISCLSRIVIFFFLGKYQVQQEI